MKVRFGEEHLLRFSAASLDFNPAHLSRDYARKTPAGERVVYGMLGFLASLRELTLPAHSIPSDVRIDFKSALVLDVDYTITAEREDPAGTRVLLLDGSATMMRARLQFRSGNPEWANLPESGMAPQHDSRRLETRDFEPAPSFRGMYAPGCAAYADLLALLGIDRRSWGDALPLAALCSSYLTGMELPGESATFSGLRLKIPAAPSQTPFAFEIALGSFDDRFGLVKSRFSLGSQSAVWATGEISAMVRQPHRRAPAAGPAVGTGRFAGKSALIIGASRGLGAAMALELVAERGTVVGAFARSQQDADELAAAGHNLPGRLILVRGDASDLKWCLALKSRVRAELGKLDLLVCNAAPALQPLRVEEACYDRIRDYITKGFALVGAPLSAFLELVSASDGCVLMISSSAVEGLPAAWPHYVALKAAVEGLARTAAVANPKVTFWIARPRGLLTDLSDTPMGRLDAETPQSVARRILEQAWGQPAPGVVRVCR